MTTKDEKAAEGIQIGCALSNIRESNQAEHSAIQAYITSLHSQIAELKEELLTSRRYSARHYERADKNQFLFLQFKQEYDALKASGWEWIVTSDEHPKVGEEVLLAHFNESRDSWRYVFGFLDRDDNESYWETHKGAAELVEYSHWMSIEPPSTSVYDQSKEAPAVPKGPKKEGE
jgi:hypothetical protein